jgi:hypothetical protein
MGIESAFALNGQNNKEIEARGERRFRMRLKPMMSGVSHAQRPPLQRLGSSRLSGQVADRSTINRSNRSLTADYARLSGLLLKNAAGSGLTGTFSGLKFLVPCRHSGGDPGEKM